MSTCNRFRYLGTLCGFQQLGLTKQAGPLSQLLQHPKMQPQLQLALNPLQSLWHNFWSSPEETPETVLEKAISTEPPVELLESPVAPAPGGDLPDTHKAHVPAPLPKPTPQPSVLLLPPLQQQ